MHCVFKSPLLPALFSLLAVSSPARADLIVVPNANTGVEGDNGFLRPVDFFAITLQTAIAASELAAVAPGSRITGLTYRLNTPVLGATPPLWPASDRTWAQYNIQLSKSNFAPGALNPFFADNIGADEVAVRSGPLTIPGGSFPDTPGVPNAFGQVITFSSPYTYTGGDLLITIRHTGNGVDSDHMDGVSDSALISTIAAFGFATPAEDGLFAPGSPVYQLQFEPVAAPEPATFILLGVGALAGYARLRPKRAA